MIQYPCKSDTHIGGNIFLGASALHSPHYREMALDGASVINRSVSLFRKYLTLPPKLRFRVTSLRGNYHGYYYNDEKLVEIDCKLNKKMVLEVLAHELVHAEQYFTKKLVVLRSTKRGWVHYWNGTKGKKGTTYNSYRNQPWEIEAFDRQGDLAAAVEEELVKIYGEW